MAKIGWASGSGSKTKVPVGNASAIYPLAFLKEEASGSPYVTVATTGDSPIGIAADQLETAPTADGDQSISMYDDPNDKFWLPCYGSVTTASRYHRYRIYVSGSTHAVDITNGVGSYALYVIDVDTTANTALVRCDFSAGYLTS